MTEETKKTVTKEPEADVSKAQQERLDEMYRTHVVPSGYSFNRRDGLYKTPVKKEK